MVDDLDRVAVALVRRRCGAHPTDPSRAPTLTNVTVPLEIRELTAALNYGLNKVRFPSPVRVGSQIRAAVTVMSAQQKTTGVESVFTLTYEIDGDDRPACVADVIVLYP